MNESSQRKAASHRILPGFRVSLGYTLVYLTVLLIVPLAACLVKVSSLTASQFIAAVFTERARADLPPLTESSCCVINCGSLGH
jgi:ABC-type sulfate transport system permease component